MKKLTKLFSILILTFICSFSFIACSNNENIQASQINTSSMSDTSSSNDDIAENVSDSVENETNTYPITPGIYKFEKETLTFDDIYYKNDVELLEYFQTRDLNGVYDFVYKVGFDNFVSSITTVNINGVNYKTAVDFNKNKSNDTELGYFRVFESYKDTYTYLNDVLIYNVVDNSIVNKTNCPEIIANKESNNVTILYPFYYVDAETSETVYTPLYIKAILSLYNTIDLIHDDSIKCYTYLDNSAKIVSENNYLNKDEALQKLTEMIPLDKDSIIGELENIKFCVKDNNDLYILYFEDTILLSEKIEDSNCYFILDVVKIEILCEYYDLTLDLNILTAQIEIEENVFFRCDFVA